MQLHEIARNHVVTLDIRDSVDKAIALMEEHDIRHLPVLDGPDAIGIVSDRDLLSAVGWLTNRERATASVGTAHIGPTRIAEVMSSPVKTLAPDDRFEKAAWMMLHESFSAVPLVNEEGIVGIVTESDYLRCYLDHRKYRGGTSWRFQNVSDHMTTEVVTCEPSVRASAAFRLMKSKHIRHLPIVKNGKLVGIVSDRDVRRSFMQDRLDDLEIEDDRPGRAHRTTLKEIMNRDVQKVSPNATLAEAADRMLSYRIGALPVTDLDKFIGIISETDLLRLFAATCETSVV